MDFEGWGAIIVKYSESLGIVIDKDHEGDVGDLLIESISILLERVEFVEEAEVLSLEHPLKLRLALRLQNIGLVNHHEILVSLEKVQVYFVYLFSVDQTIIIHQRLPKFTRRVLRHDHTRILLDVVLCIDLIFLIIPTRFARKATRIIC